MRLRNVIVGLSVASLLSVSAVPAFAQVGDFFCSTFSIGCAPPPPPPPPPVPVEEPVAPAPKHKVRKAKPKRTAAPKSDAATGTPQ